MKILTVSLTLVAAIALIHLGGVHAEPAETPAKADADQRSTAPPEMGSKLDEILVTARKRAEKLSEAPVAVQAFTGTALEQQGISRVQQLGILDPSLNVTATTILIDSIFLRGVGSSPNDPGFEQQTALFVDGIYYGNGRWISSATFDTDLVQILAGPQGAYFGKNTIAGAIDIRTRNPGHTFENRVTGGYEFKARERYGEGVISGPLSRTLGARLSARASRMSGWATNDPTGGREPGASDGVGRLTLAWTPTDHFDSNLKLQVQDYNDNGPTALTILLNCTGPGNTPAPLSLQGFPIWGPTSGTAPCTRNFHIPGPQQLREGRANSHVPAYTSALALHWRHAEGELTSITGYNHYGFGSYLVANASSLDAVELRNEAKNDAVSTELRYRSLLPGRVNFMLGGYYQSTDFRYYSAPDILPRPLQGAQSTFQQRSSTASHTQSYFLEVLWDITGRWELDLGERYTRERKDSKVDTLSVAPPVAALFPALHFTAEQQFDNSSPQATLSWRPGNRFMTYAAYKTGFLSGGFAHAQLPSPASQVQNFLFGAETARGGELGTKFSLARSSVSFDLVAYYYDYDGLQVSTFQPASLTFAVQNAGKSRSKGIELRSLWHVTPPLSVHVAVTHGSTQYTRYLGACLPTATFATGCNVPLPGGGFGQDFSGTRTSFSPDWTARTSLDYQRALRDGMSLSAGVGVSYNDGYTVGDVLHQPAWAKYDSRVALEVSSWRFALIGNNLSNVPVCDQAAFRPLGAAGETTCWLDRGREIRFELSAEL